MSSLKYYDSSVQKYFETIQVDDGVKNRIIPVYMAVPSRNSVKIQTNNNETPIMPYLCLTRNGLSPNTVTHLIKGHITRNSIFKSMSSNLKNYDMLEKMAYDFNYQLDIFALQQEQFNQIVEQILYKTEKHHYVPVHIEIDNFCGTDNAYISNITYTDGTTYNQISDTTYRIFHGTLTFTVHGYITNINQSAKSVLTINKDVDVNNEKAIIDSYTGTVEELIEKRKKQNLN